MTDTDYHLIHVPGLGHVRVPINCTAEDVLRDVAEAAEQDTKEEPEQKG